LKYSNDSSDATWLAHMLRLGLLPAGYIYPKETRAVPDLLRKRGHLVRQRTAHILSIENLTSRNTGLRINGNQVKNLTAEQVGAHYENKDLALAQVRHEDAVNRLKSNKVNLGTGRVCTTFLIKMEAIGQSDSQLIQ
jgi:hypothetical protein